MRDVLGDLDRRDDDNGVNLTRSCVGSRIGPEVGSVESGYEHPGRRTVKCNDYFGLLRISASWSG